MANKIEHGQLYIVPKKETPHWMYPHEITSNHKVYSNFRIRAGNNPTIGHFLELDTTEGYYMANGGRGHEKRTMISLDEQDMRALRDYLNTALGE
jgi:hypothetical protein